MALNFSHRPIFPTRLSEDNLGPPGRIASGYGVPERNLEGFGRPWHSNWEIENSFDYGRDRGYVRERDRCERGGSQESVSIDIVDLLPSDPFGMDISTTMTALTGWLEDLEVDCNGYGRGDFGSIVGDNQLFAGWNFFWNNAMKFHALPGIVVRGDKINADGTFDGYNNEERKLIGANDFGSSSNLDNFMSFRNEMGYQNGEIPVGEAICLDDDRDEGAPHAALHYALGYLGVRDLLAAERVCKAFCSIVQTDSLLWRNIHIDQPLNERITDDVLYQLTSRAQGNLQSLSLVDCTKITDDGLKRVLECNSKVTKLSVPGCTRLTIEGIVNSLKAFKTIAVSGIKHLRIAGLYGVTHKHFEELKLLLGVEDQMHQSVHKPHFYHSGHLYLPYDDDRAIDIEICPRCQNLRLVYDCPAEGCQMKEHVAQECRACILCIARCVQCGHCINDSEYEETFCLEFLCSECQETG
ncbi:F-box domain [Dillenia turbinata]|uniref:F-box domain n=1 Tax=Dillenia turbinata TaxID=194707 RepID=A0AAN8VB32_9MAGN